MIAAHEKVNHKRFQVKREESRWTVHAEYRYESNCYRQHMISGTGVGSSFVMLCV